MRCKQQLLRSIPAQPTGGCLATVRRREAGDGCAGAAAATRSGRLGSHPGLRGPQALTGSAGSPPSRSRGAPTRRRAGDPEEAASESRAENRPRGVGNRGGPLPAKPAGPCQHLGCMHLRARAFSCARVRPPQESGDPPAAEPPTDSAQDSDAAPARPGPALPHQGRRSERWGRR